MRIRPYEYRDASAVRALFIRINREIASESMRERFEAYIARSLEDEIDRIPAYYAQSGGSFWIAEDAGTLAGMFGLERLNARSAELRRMYVTPEWRRRGIARALLDHAEQICRCMGFRTLFLSTSELQQPALALYVSCGFQLVHDEPAADMTNKTVGGGLRRFHLTKSLAPGERFEPSASPRSGSCGIGSN